MLTNATFKTYAGEIAKLYCKGQQNSPLCRATVRQRIINSFTNETFENSFLPNLDKNRFYSIETVRIDKKRHIYKITFRGFDIVTGAETELFETTLPSGLWTLKKYDMFFTPHSMRLVGVNNNRFIVRRTGVNYGIVFVLKQVDPEPVPGTGNEDDALQCPPGYRWHKGKCESYGIVPTPMPKPGGVPTTQPPPGIVFNWEMWVVPALIAGTVFYMWQAKS